MTFPSAGEMILQASISVFLSGSRKKLITRINNIQLNKTIIFNTRNEYINEKIDSRAEMNRIPMMKGLPSFAMGIVIMISKKQFKGFRKQG